MKTFFDLDGTILDITPRWYALHENLARAHGLPVLPRDGYVARKIEGLSERAIMEESGATDLDAIKAYAEDRVAHIEDDQYLAQDVLIPGIRAVLDIAKKENPLVLITLRKRADALHAQLNELGLSAYFDAILLVEASSKQEAIRQNYNESDYEGALFVSDGEDDYHTALALRMHPLLVSYGTRSRSFLEAAGIPNLIPTTEELRMHFLSLYE